MSASPETCDFRAFQTAFAARIRDPRGRPRPQAVPARRMRVYEELLFNNLEGFLLACFPITRTLLGARAWRRTVRRFFAEHRCTSPLFRDIPGAFLDWIEPLADTLFPKRPYLYEFMHYEWLELTVSVCPDEGVAGDIHEDADLLMEQPRLNPTAQLVCYHYPVHRIGPRFKSAGPDGQLYCYLVYRDRDDVVQFIVLNPASARLLDIIREGCDTGFAAMAQLARELGHTRPDTVVEMGTALLENLRRAGAMFALRRVS